MAQCHKNIRKFRSKYHLTKKECADLFEVSENTIGNYENENKNQLIKSYVLVNLKQNDKYKDIPIEFFLGLTTSMEKENIEINSNLGLSDKSIGILRNIAKDNDSLKKQIKLFAINKLIENIDLDKLSHILIFPNYENEHINSKDFYNAYSNYFQESYYHNTDDYIKKERDINDYTLSKIFLKTCDNIRNSKECIDIFNNFIVEENNLKNMMIDDNYDDDNINYEENIYYENPNIERNEIIKLRENDIGK